MNFLTAITGWRYISATGALGRTFAMRTPVVLDSRATRRGSILPEVTHYLEYEQRCIRMDHRCIKTRQSESRGTGSNDGNSKDLQMLTSLKVTVREALPELHNQEHSNDRR